jgi:hypothetical protein
VRLRDESRNRTKLYRFENLPVVRGAHLCPLNPRFAGSSGGGIIAGLATARQMGATNAITSFSGDDDGSGSIRGDSGKRAGDGGPKLHMQQYTAPQWILH